MYHYTLKHGTYFLYADTDVKEKNILKGCDEIAICFSFGGITYTLHKHGDPKWVNKWMEDTKKSYEGSHLADFAGKLMVVQGKFPVEEINKIINNSGYIGAFLKKFKLTPNANPASRALSEEPPEQLPRP
jgi:hypothetical protein